MAKQTIKLSELPFGSKIEIGGFQYTFKGYDKRKTQFGRQEHFIFWSDEAKTEKIFEKFKFSTTKIKKHGDNYQW